MPGIPRLVTLGSRPIRVAMAGPQETLVVNRGTVTCWLSTNDGLSADSDQVAILDPGGTLLVQGDANWWGITPDGSDGLVNSIPGAVAQSWSAQAIADAIAGEGGLMTSAVYDPADDGLLAATEDPWASTISGGMTDAQHGTILLSRIMVRKTITTSKITVLYVPGSTGGQAVYFGLYSAAGALIAQTASIAALLTAADTSHLSPVEASFTAQAGLTAGLYWGALLQAASGAASPSWWGSALNAGSALSPALNPATARTGFVGTTGSFAALPASFIPGTDITIPADNALVFANPFWFGLK